MLKVAIIKHMFRAARTSGWEQFTEIDETNLKDIIDFLMSQSPDSFIFFVPNIKVVIILWFCLKKCRF